MSSVERLLRVSEVASLLHVSESSVWNWVTEGRIKSVRLPAKANAKRAGAIRIPSVEVFRIMEGRKA